MALLLLPVVASASEIETATDQYKTTAPWKDFPTTVALKDGDPSPTNPAGGPQMLSTYSCLMKTCKPAWLPESAVPSPNSHSTSILQPNN